MTSEFLALLCNLYIMGLTVALPLYTQNGWWRLGDVKYGLFRNLSVCCFAVWALSALISGVRCLAGRFGQGRRSDGGQTAAAGGPGAGFGRRHSPFSAMDACVLLYGCCALCSALVSAWPQTAWTGYREWYMGALSQLSFVGIYFFVSRCYTGKRYVVRLWAAAFFLVLLLGFLQRLGLDPLGLTEGFGTASWEYSHMLSTVGNINWFCGYCAMSMVLPLSGYLRSRERWERGLLYVVSVLGLFVLFTQGSDSGVLLGAVALGICFLWGLQRESIFRRTCGLAAGVCLLIPAYGNLAGCLGERAVMAFPLDGIGLRQLQWPGWWMAGAFFLFLWLLCRLLSGDGGIRGGKERSVALRVISLLVVALFFLGGMAVGLVHLLRQPAGALWGNGRGVLWKTSWEGFLRGSGLQKLLGAGPDCFAEYVYSTFPATALPALEGRWKGVVFANAHNEWLNQLINLGILGTGAYLGTFLAGAWRYRRHLAGVLAIALYLAASLIGFQQVLSTPFLFLLLGLCESAQRAGAEDVTWQEGDGQAKRK